MKSTSSKGLCIILALIVTLSVSFTPQANALYQIPREGMSTSGSRVLISAPIPWCRILLTSKTAGQASAAPSAAPTAAPTVKPTTAPAAAPTAKPTTAPAALPSSSSEQSTMLRLINEDRTREGLKPLTLSAELSAAARKHSLDMVNAHYFSHTSPEFGSFSERLAASGIRTAGAGENIARYGSIEKAHAALMASDGHRANLMNPNYTHIGLGIVRDASGVYTITQWVAKLPG